ncbi:10013_t:CDS:1, partial [Acaulospora colombiana]
GLRIFVKDRKMRTASIGSRKSGDFGSIRSLRSLEMNPKADQSLGDVLFGTGTPAAASDHSSDLSSTDEAPQSPSPSPRPQSAMSRPNSIISRRALHSHSAGPSSAGIVPNISAANVNPRPVSFRRATTSVAPVASNSQSFAQPSSSSSKSTSQPTPAHSIFSTTKPPSSYEQRLTAQDIPPLDPDATPKPKRPPSSSAPPIFVPPAPIFTKNAPNIQPKPRDFAFGIDGKVTPAGMVSSTPRPAIANQRANLPRVPSEPRSSAAAIQDTRPTESDELKEMRERLNRMMQDIDSVSDQIQKVKMQLK